MNPTSERRPSGAWALASLLIANLVPLVGVYLWGWRLTDLLMLYWLENAVVGLFTVLAIVAARPAGQAWWTSLAAKLLTVPFFIVHYGMFWLGHGFFLVSFFGRDAAAVAGGSENFLLTPLVFSWMRIDVLAWPVALMLVSHGVSFFTNFLASGEYRTVGVPQLMMRPYGRVVVLHVTIVLGGFVAVAIGPSLGILLLFVVVKIVADVSAYLLEQRRLAGEGRSYTVVALSEEVEQSAVSR